jgi:hypothetical protein
MGVRLWFGKTQPNATMKKQKLRKEACLTTLLALAASLGLSPLTVLAADPPTPEERMKQLEELVKQQNTKIEAQENRIKQMEGRAEALGMSLSNVQPNKVLTLLDGVNLSGYVQGSYLYSTSKNPPSRAVVGRSFDRFDDQFSLNAVKLTLQRPVSTNDWDAGFRVDFMYGQNATLIQSSGLSLGTQGDIEQAYAEFNVPVGHGLNVKVGKMVTLMGVEVIEDTVNPTWSEGNQFLFAENFTSTGIQLGYKWNDMFDTQFSVNNGWDVVADNNRGKSFMGRLGITLDPKTVIGLVGYAGAEQAGNSGAWRKGINVVVSRAVTDKLKLWGQFDYGHEEANAALPKPTTDAQWLAGGLWATYDFTPKWGIGLRADYFNDKDGARTSLAPFTAPFPLNTHNEFESYTLTLNCRQWNNLLLRPELRYDHSSVSKAFGESRDQFTVGMSATYLF